MKIEIRIFKFKEAKMHEILECKLERLDFTVIQWFQHIHSKLSFYLQFM